MTLWPRSLFGRLALLLLLVILISQATAIFLFRQDRAALLSRQFGDTKIVHELAVSQYQGIKLWAECVKKAGSLERNAVLKAIESGPKIEGPSGSVVLDAKTHHAALDIYVMEVQGQKLTIKETHKQRAPSDTAQYCDLIKNPKENKQFEVKI